MLTMYTNSLREVFLHACCLHRLHLRDPTPTGKATTETQRACPATTTQTAATTRHRVARTCRIPLQNKTAKSRWSSHLVHSKATTSRSGSPKLSVSGKAHERNNWRQSRNTQSATSMVTAIRYRRRSLSDFLLPRSRRRRVASEEVVWGRPSEALDRAWSRDAISTSSLPRLSSSRTCVTEQSGRQRFLQTNAFMQDNIRPLLETSQGLEIATEGVCQHFAENVAQVAERKHILGVSMLHSVPSGTHEQNKDRC
jgi:hypothetical protein